MAMCMPYHIMLDDEDLKELEKEMDVKRAEMISKNCIKEDDEDWWYSRADPVSHKNPTEAQYEYLSPPLTPHSSSPLSWRWPRRHSS